MRTRQGGLVVDLVQELIQVLAGELMPALGKEEYENLAKELDQELGKAYAASRERVQDFANELLLERGKGGSIKSWCMSVVTSAIKSSARGP